MKQMLHELGSRSRWSSEDRFAEAYKAMARISRIQAVMTLSWDVLSTLTPVDYLEVPRRARHRLGVPVGAVPRDRVSARAQGPDVPRSLCRRQRRARGARRPRSTSRACAKRRIAALERAGFDLGDRSVEALAAAWLQVYRDADRWFELYELAEKLVDIDDALAAWRHKHVLTVERIIGNKRGHRRLGRRALSALDARQARLPRAVGAEDRSLSFKALFSRSLGGRSRPAALRGAQPSSVARRQLRRAGRGVERRRAARRPQVGQGDGRGLARGAGRGRARARHRRSPTRSSLRPTPTISSSGWSPPRRARTRPLRVLTSDGEFHSARRQFARWEEEGWIDGRAGRRRAVRQLLRALPRAPREPASTTSSSSARCCSAAAGSSTASTSLPRSAARTGRGW